MPYYTIVVDECRNSSIGFVREVYVSKIPIAVNLGSNHICAKFVTVSLSESENERSAMQNTNT
jgi:hypothetical protein